MSDVPTDAVESTDDDVEEKRRLDDQRAALGEADETCVFLLDDLLAGIFEEMQVRVQNAALFTTSARQMCAKAFEAVEMSALEPSDSLDRSGRQQILKAQSQRTPSLQRRSFDASTPLVFLRRLRNFLDKRVDRAGLELQQFPSSEAVSMLSGKRKLISGRVSDGGNEWCIPVDQVSVFLQHLLSKGLVSAAPNTVTFVMAVNREALTVKNAHARVALSHLQNYVENAILTTEEEQETRDKPQSCRSLTDESTPRSRIFHTEVKVPLKLPASGPKQELLSSYLEEISPQAVAMDRRAPGQVAKKATLTSTQRAISRKVRLLLAPPPRLGSRWKTVRHKLIIPPTDASVGITAEADLELNIASYTQDIDKETSVENEDTPDAAALSNIFCLGTPRQLSAQELARRNDLLAQLEREAARSQRRATATVIAAMSLSEPRESDGTCTQDFQAYVAANSIVTIGLSPTRPQQNDRRGRGRAKIQRSKFEQERETLPFSVCDGNSHTRDEQERLSAAMCSPIKRPRASVAQQPETPGRPIQIASTLAPLPQLDSLRLAVGVSAVVRDVEKRGPRRNPSRNSRLQLHNYSAAFDGVDLEDSDTEEIRSQLPFSPVRTVATKENLYRLPVIPVVSPIKASPHRKHVAFKAQPVRDNERTALSISPKAQVRQHPSVKVKQQVWEATTRGKNFRRYDEPMAPRRNVLATSDYED